MLTARHMKTARSLYLYSDGHAVVCHQKKDKDAGEVRWVTLHESIGVTPLFDCDGGRLIVTDRAAIAMILACHSVRCNPASLDRGSNRTKERGIAVETIALNFGYGETFFYNMPGLISCDLVFQTGIDESWDDVKSVRHWSIDPVGEVIPLKQRNAA
jgi:hypothetical protein